MNPYYQMRRPATPMPNQPGSDRFIFPFLVGAVTGGAAVGLTRPRPIYNVAPQPYPPYQPYPPMGPYGNYSYNYYYPYR